MDLKEKIIGFIKKFKKSLTEQGEGLSVSATVDFSKGSETKNKQGNVTQNGNNPINVNSVNGNTYINIGSVPDNGKEKRFKEDDECLCNTMMSKLSYDYLRDFIDSVIQNGEMCNSDDIAKLVAFSEVLKDSPTNIFHDEELENKRKRFGTDYLDFLEDLCSLIGPEHENHFSIRNKHNDKEMQKQLESELHSKAKKALDGYNDIISYKRNNP